MVQFSDYNMAIVIHCSCFCSCSCSDLLTFLVFFQHFQLFVFLKPPRNFFLNKIHRFGFVDSDQSISIRHRRKRFGFIDSTPSKAIPYFKVIPDSRKENSLSRDNGRPKKNCWKVLFDLQSLQIVLCSIRIDFCCTVIRNQLFQLNYAYLRSVVFLSIPLNFQNSVPSTHFIAFRMLTQDNCPSLEVIANCPLLYSN